MYINLYMPKYIHTFSICIYIHMYTHTHIYTYMKESKGQYMEGLGRGKKGKGMM